jgi:hypothetical protein
MDGVYASLSRTSMRPGFGACAGPATRAALAGMPVVALPDSRAMKDDAGSQSAQAYDNSGPFRAIALRPSVLMPSLPPRPRRHRIRVSP